MQNFGRASRPIKHFLRNFFRALAAFARAEIEFPWLPLVSGAQKRSRVDNTIQRRACGFERRSRNGLDGLKPTQIDSRGRELDATHESIEMHVVERIVEPTTSSLCQSMGLTPFQKNIRTYLTAIRD